MADENNSSNEKSNSKQGNPNGTQNGIPEGKTGTFEQTDPKDARDAANGPLKPTITVRFWHALWRKRIFFHHHGPNWAEISVVILTAGILLVGAIQAYIYYKQAQTMERSLEQNQQSIALNMGQVALAGRNATTAENTLAEMKNGGADTHTLAESTKSAVKAASGQLITMQQQVELSRLEQRSWIQIIPPKFTNADIADDKTIQFPFDMQNVGKVASKQLNGIVVVEIVPSAQPPSFDYNGPHSNIASVPIFPTGKSGFLAAAWTPGHKPSEITSEQREQLASGDYYLAIYGEMNYGDIFGDWWTHFCVWHPFIPKGKGVVIYNSRSCVDYNTEGGSFRKEGEKH